MADLPVCFVIMPFSQTTAEHTEDYWTNHYTSFLKPLIEVGGDWQARRSTALRGDIIKEIISDLVTAHVVVTDLTDANSNVYWELGVRQSFRHGTITIAEVGTKLPFDIGAKGTLFYHPKNHLKMEDFRKQFALALKSCATEPERPDSHVLEALSGRGTIYELIRRDEAIRRIEALIDELAYNVAEVEKIRKRAEDNLKDSSKRRFHTRLLRVPCCELLMTTRYVDKDASFYRILDRAYADCTAINNQLGLWEHSPSTTDRWLFDDAASTTKNFKALQDLLGPLLADHRKRR